MLDARQHDLEYSPSANIPQRHLCIEGQTDMWPRESTTRMHYLVGRVAEVLNLSLRELAHAQQPGTRGDLVAVRLPDLRGGEWQLAAVVVQQVSARG